MEESWLNKLTRAEVRAQRALKNDGVDPVSGFTLEDLQAFIENCPFEFEYYSLACLRRLGLFQEVDHEKK